MSIVKRKKIYSHYKDSYEKSSTVIDAKEMDITLQIVMYQIILKVTICLEIYTNFNKEMTIN